LGRVIVFYEFYPLITPNTKQSFPKHGDQPDGSITNKCAPAWHKSICSSRKYFKQWLLHPNNTAHNRQAKTLINWSNITSPANSSKECLNLNGNKDYEIFKPFESLNYNENLFNGNV